MYSMSYAVAFTALADPTRRRIYERIARRPRAVAEIGRGIPISQPAVSQHLRALREAGLVHSRAEGTRRIYYADPKGLAALRRYVESLWDDVLTAFAAHVENSEEP